MKKVHVFFTSGFTRWASQAASAGVFSSSLVVLGRPVMKRSDDGNVAAIKRGIATVAPALAGVPGAASCDRLYLTGFGHRVYFHRLVVEEIPHNV